MYSGFIPYPYHLLHSSSSYPSIHMAIANSSQSPSASGTTSSSAQSCNLLPSLSLSPYLSIHSSYTYIYIYILLHNQINPSLLCIHPCTHAYIHTYFHSMYMRACLRSFVRVDAHTHTYIYICIYTHLLHVRNTNAKLTLHVCGALHSCNPVLISSPRPSFTAMFSADEHVDGKLACGFNRLGGGMGGTWVVGIIVGENVIGEVCR